MGDRFLYRTEGCRFESLLLVYDRRAEPLRWFGTTLTRIFVLHIRAQREESQKQPGGSPNENHGSEVCTIDGAFYE